MNNKHLRDSIRNIRAHDDKIATAQSIMKAAQEERRVALAAFTQALKYEMKALLSDMSDYNKGNQLRVEEMTVNAQSASVFVLCFQKVYEEDGKAARSGSLSGDHAIALDVIASAMKRRLIKADIEVDSVYVTVADHYWSPATRSALPIYD